MFDEMFHQNTPAIFLEYENPRFFHISCHFLSQVGAGCDVDLDQGIHLGKK